MKKISRICVASLLLLAFSTAPLVAGDDSEKPISGKSFTITYPGPEKAQLKPDTLTVVYVFDYWGTAATADRSPSALYANVVNPSPDRVHSVPLKKKGSRFVATIDIPKNVSLLSYYVTDGTTKDDNAGGTYVRYVYGPAGKPVMGARFRKIDFLVMSGKSVDEQIGELAAELKDYPQNRVAYIPYWTLKFSKVTTLKSLKALKPSIETMLASMEQNGVSIDTVRNLRAGISFRYALQIRTIYTTEYKAALRDLESQIEAIPEAKRFGYISAIYQTLKNGGYEP